MQQCVKKSAIATDTMIVRRDPASSRSDTSLVAPVIVESTKTNATCRCTAELHWSTSYLWHNGQLAVVENNRAGSGRQPLSHSAKVADIQYNKLFVQFVPGWHSMYPI